MKPKLGTAAVIGLGLMAMPRFRRKVRESVGDIDVPQVKDAVTTRLAQARDYAMDIDTEPARRTVARASAPALAAAVRWVADSGFAERGANITAKMAKKMEKEKKRRLPGKGSGAGRLTVLGATLLGGAAAYLLDPENGPRRRSQLLDRASSLLSGVRQAGEGVAQQATSQVAALRPSVGGTPSGAATSGEAGPTGSPPSSQASANPARPVGGRSDAAESGNTPTRRSSVEVSTGSN